MDRVDLEAIRGIDGVMGVVESDTLQIVFGPGVVNEVLNASVELTGIPRGARSDVEREPPPTQIYVRGRGIDAPYA